MGIPEINMISDFEAGMNCLQNPSLISGSFAISGIGRISQVYGFWKWGALIFAMLAIINRIKLLVISRLRRIRSFASPEALLQPFLDDFDFSDDDDDTCSSAATPSEADDCASTTSFDDREGVDEDFSVAGLSSYLDSQWQNCNLRLRRRRSGGIGECFSWSDFAAGKSVVKLWDSLGLGFDMEDSSESVVSFWDLNKDQKVSSILCGRLQNPAVSMSSPSVVLSAGNNKSGNVVLGAYDTRIGRKTPAICAEWRPMTDGDVAGINSGGVEKVYVRDDVTGTLTVGDMRNVKAPLESISKSDGETWWDADAVIVSDDSVDD